MNWSVDPSRNRLKTPRGVLKLCDAYSQWVFGYGRAFAPGTYLHQDNPDDFDFAVLPGQTLRNAEVFAVGPLDDDANQARPPRYDGIVGVLPVRATSVPARMPGDPAMPDLPDPEKLVITGVIDDGINVFQDRFQGQNTSRVDFAWVQDAPAGGAVPFGAELTGAEITTAKATGQSDTVLMREHGLIGDPRNQYRPTLLSRGNSHGTLVTDLAGGASQDDPDADHHRLITVQLPALGTLDTSGSTLISAVELAISYIYERAAAMSAHLGVAIPVVINFSYGLSSGARNGRQYLERKMREASLRYRRATAAQGHDLGAPTFRVLPAGNSQLRRGHACALGDATALDLSLRLIPDDRTASFLEIWCPGAATTVDIRVTGPDGTSRAIQWTKLQTRTFPIAAHILKAEDGDVLARVTLDSPQAGDPDQDGLHWRILVAFAPTTAIHDRAGVAAGLWRLEASCDSGTVPIAAWAQRDDTLNKLGPYGRQPYFDDPQYRQWDPDGRVSVTDPVPPVSAVLRDGTLSGLVSNARLPDEPADAHLDTIAVTGVEWVNSAAAVYASAASDGARAPRIAEISDTSHIMAGVMGAGTLSGTSAVLNGTSVASPQIARRLARHLMAMPPSKRSGFDALAWLATQGVAPRRPVADSPQVAYRPGIRDQQLGPDGRVIGLERPDRRGVAQR